MKDTVDYHYLPRRMVKLKILTLNAAKDAEKLDHSDTADENLNYAATLGKSLAGSCEAKRGLCT